MPSTTSYGPLSSWPNHPDPVSSKHCAAFARECALDAFGRQAVHHLNGAGFVDREPLDELRDPEEAVDGREAVARWLKLAANADGEAAETAFETADEIRRVLGLEWSDVIQRRAA